MAPGLLSCAIPFKLSLFQGPGMSGHAVRKVVAGWKPAQGAGLQLFVAET